MNERQARTETPPTRPFRFRRLTREEVLLETRSSLSREVIEQARAIVDDVESRGESALRRHAERLGDLPAGAPLVRTREECEKALASLDPEDRAVLARTAARIERFAAAQLETFSSLTLEVDGGRAGHQLVPVQTAGCYAPGGRFPLPSTVLMTGVTARVAGVSRVWLASPRPAPATLAAAAIAGVDGVLQVGGAQAIAALAFGCGPVPRCDAVVGPGNSWVTAAKDVLAGQVAIDSLAGPTELLVLADDSADPRWIAADLLAQAEHDPEAFAGVITWRDVPIEAIEAAIDEQLRDLSTASTAGAALARSWIVQVTEPSEATELCSRLAPEHVQLCAKNAGDLAGQIRDCGAVFLGNHTPAVLGDYGAGPNHVLPTGATSRSFGGLSVLNFLRVRTWMEADPGEMEGALLDDVVRLARMEGLEGHARAAEIRRERSPARAPEEVDFADREQGSI